MPDPALENEGLHLVVVDRTSTSSELNVLLFALLSPTQLKYRLDFHQNSGQPVDKKSDHLEPTTSVDDKARSWRANYPLYDPAVGLTMLPLVTCDS